MGREARRPVDNAQSFGAAARLTFAIGLAALTFPLVPGLAGAESRTLTITKAGDGSGGVNQSTGQRLCDAQRTICKPTFSDGYRVTLHAVPWISSFWAWSGDCPVTAGDCTLVMDESRDVTAAFVKRVPIKVVNTAGRPQADVWFLGEAGGTTDSTGLAQVSGLHAGGIVKFTRGGGSPEGNTGASATMPETGLPPNDLTVEVPTVLKDLPYQPTGEARWLAGIINQGRARAGEEPLRVSTTLSAVAAYVASDGGFQDKRLRIPLIDSGWPGLEFDGDKPANVSGVGASDYYGNDLFGFYEDGKFDEALKPEYESIGVAHVGGEWVGVLGGACDAEPACGMTEDTGVAPAYLHVTKGGSGSGSVAVSPKGYVLNSAKCRDPFPPPACDSPGYDSGTEVTITANPAVDSRVARWSGAKCEGEQCSITLSEDETPVDVKFALIHHVHLRLAKAQRRERILKLRFKLARRAKGKLKVGPALDRTRRGIAEKRRIHATRRGRNVVARVRLYPSNWYLGATFRGKKSWPQRESVCYRVHVKGTPADWTRAARIEPQPQDKCSAHKRS